MFQRQTRAVVLKNYCVMDVPSVYQASIDLGYLNFSYMDFGYLEFFIFIEQ